MFISGLYGPYILDFHTEPRPNQVISRIFIHWKLTRREHHYYSTFASEKRKLLLPNNSPMVRKRFRDAKTGLLLAKSFDAEKYLKKIGLGKEDHYFWKQVGKALLCTYALIGVAWLWNETSPLGWWTLKPRPKEERELAHLYEHRKFPYPGDQEAMEEFIRKGGMIGTAIGPKGFVETDKDSVNYQKTLQDKKLDQEAMKLWMRMRSEVMAELQEKGFDVE